MKKAVVVTGASTGIGYAAAKELIARGYHVFGSVRKAADGQRVQSELGNSFTPLLFDVTDHEALPAAVEQVRAAVGDQGLAGLINNAGIAHCGPLMHLPLSEFRQVFEINVVGVLAVTQAFAPLLGARRDCPHAPGRIINMSSISGGVAFPMVAAYAVSKHALEALTDGMRRELHLYGIEVSAIEPGTKDADLGQETRVGARQPLRPYRLRPGNEQHHRPVIERELKRAKPVSVVVDAIVDALEAPRPRTRYPLVGLWHLRKLLPDRMFDRLMRKEIGGLDRLH
jgi:NAD(P)-dependent dehydrogenase (short-subunit alcohol dehydrogenase family)